MLGVLKDILVHFDKANGIWVSTKHTCKSETEDRVKIITELLESEVFVHKPGRKHSTFSSTECNKLLKSINRRNFDVWMNKNALEILNVSPLSN